MSEKADQKETTTKENSVPKQEIHSTTTPTTLGPTLGQPEFVAVANVVTQTEPWKYGVQAQLRHGSGHKPHFRYPLLRAMPPASTSTSCARTFTRHGSQQRV